MFASRAQCLPSGATFAKFACVFLFIVSFLPLEAAAQIDCDTLKRAVVRIDASSVGTGLIFNAGEKGLYILTAHHVVKGAQKITVTHALVPNIRLPATLVAYYEPLDLAILNLPNRSTSTPSMYCGGVLALNEPVSIIGHPTGLNWQCYTGIDTVTRLDFEGDSAYFLFTNPMVQPGLSGAPLFNDDGEVIGIALGRAPSGNGKAIHIREAFTRVKWPVSPNVLSLKSNPNRLYNLRLVNNSPSSITFDIDYNFESFRQLGPGSVSGSVVSSGSSVPETLYSPGQLKDVAGTARVGIQAISGGGTTTGIRFCIHAGGKTVLCKKFPYRKVWAVSEINGITSASVIENSPGFLKLSVGYRYNGDGKYAMVIAQVTGGGKELFDFATPNQTALPKGSGTTVFSLRNAGASGRVSDTIRLCLVEITLDNKIGNVNLAACQTLQLRKVW